MMLQALRIRKLVQFAIAFQARTAPILTKAQAQIRFALKATAIGLISVCLSSAAKLNADDSRATTLPETILSDKILQFKADMATLQHRFRVPLEPASMDRKRNLLTQWQLKLQEVDFDRLSSAGKIDYLLLRTELEYRRSKLDSDWERDKRAVALLPYADGVIDFCKHREDVDVIDPRDAGQRLDKVAHEVEKVAEALQASGKKTDNELPTSERLRALRAAELIREFSVVLKESHNFYMGYDPLYSWWAKKPWERLDGALAKHRVALRETLVGVPESDKDTIIGLPIGADGLARELKHEWIAYQPEMLIEIAEQEMKWCDQQMLLASQELGFGDDWRKAMDSVKAKHVEPGHQPRMIRDLAWEAIRFLEANDLVTVPPLAAQGWRMTMMSPEAQRVNPYFLGGDSIIVSFPTDSMTHDEKLMSMRSNNIHFARATVHHELIPGHHLQFHMLARHRTYREMFNTPFWIEGWALYWEMLLWDLGFAHGPEDRVGMLFWRRHRCARILFSLNYHLGKMSPSECVDFLVDRVGHERSAAAAEVRRSIMGNYGPLYQAAYMLGGLQIRALHKELVQGGRMSNRQFHDAVLKEHSIPIELLRAQLTNQDLARDANPQWRFSGT